MKGVPVCSAFALPVVGLSIQGLWTLSLYMSSPDRDVPQWLMVTAADMDRCTLIIQIMVLAVVFVALVGATVAALEGDRIQAVITLPVGLWVVFTAVFTSPEFILGTRYWRPPGALDSLPYSTDFDYATYLRQLLPQLGAPLAWAVGAAVPVCLGAVAISWAGDRYRRSSAAMVVDSGARRDSGNAGPALDIRPELTRSTTKAPVLDDLPAAVSAAAPSAPPPAYLLYPSDEKARAFQEALMVYRSRGCQVVTHESGAIFIYGPKGMPEDEFQALHRRAWGR